MRKEIPLVEQKNEEHLSRGLMPVVCYDPWFPRALESIKQSIHDGHPVLIRLHSGSSYPVDPDTMYKNDLESHAVLIIGYDDAKQSVIVMDPWDKNWGGQLGGKRLISYMDLGIHTVDCTRGFCMTLAPLDLKSKPIWKPNGSLDLKLEMGFYTPRGSIMDLKTWIISELKVECSIKENPLIKECVLVGKWQVDHTSTVEIPFGEVSSSNFEVVVKVQAKIQGTRPYPFEDYVQTIKEFAFEKPDTCFLEEAFEKIATN